MGFESSNVTCCVCLQVTQRVKRLRTPFSLGATKARTLPSGDSEIAEYLGSEKSSSRGMNSAETCAKKRKSAVASHIVGAA